MDLSKKIFIYIIFIFSIFLGYFLNENSSGGAKIDHDYFKPFINYFYVDFNFGLKKFLENPATIIQLPVFYIIIGSLLKLFNSLVFIKVVYIIISCFLPFLFYLILKNKFKVNKQYIFLICFLIFLSPYFRSSAIWLLGDNLSLVFFSLSVLFFLKSHNKKKIEYLYISIFFLILCSYIRHYYSFFILYYLFYTFKNFKTKYFLYILIGSFIFSLPALFYLNYIILNYNFIETISAFGNINYLNSSLIILTILLFYTIPFILDKKFSIIMYYKKNYKIFSFIVFLFLLLILIDTFFFENLITFPRKGGGVFIKLIIALPIDLKEILLVFTGCISFLLIDFLFKDDRTLNYLLLVLLIISLPFLVIYQKYLDPLFYIFFFGLINSNYIKKIIEEKILNLYFVFVYFTGFYIFSFFYYLKIS